MFTLKITAIFGPSTRLGKSTTRSNCTKVHLKKKLQTFPHKNTLKKIKNKIWQLVYHREGNALTIRRIVELRRGSPHTSLLARLWHERSFIITVVRETKNEAILPMELRASSVFGKAQPAFKSRLVAKLRDISSRKVSE